MARPGPNFQDHHTIEQQTLRRSQLLSALSDANLFDIHAQENRIFLPSDPELANAIGTTPHSGGPISDYQEGTRLRLLRLESTVEGQAALGGDPEALRRMASRVAELRDTMKAGLINGDLYTNAPLGMTAADIRPGVQSFFGNSLTYTQTHTQQISQFSAFSRAEHGWSAITQSESRVVSTLQYTSQSSNNLIKGGDADAGRQAFSQALSDSHGSGRLVLSEAGIRQVHNVLGSEAAEPLRVPRGQQGFASMELLIGEVPRNTLIRSGGLLATGVDLTITAQRAAELAGQGNAAAAQSEINHGLARNAGGWVGGVSAAAVVGTSGFMPATLVAGDALLMSKAFEKGVDLKESYAIFNQTDRDGVSWKFTGRNWTREGSIDATKDGVSNPEQGRLGANYEKSRELGAMATAKAVDYALGKAPPPLDPFKIPARPSDQTGLDNQDWRRDPSTQQWTRMVKKGVAGANDHGVYEPEVAGAARTNELNQEAIGRIAQNLKSGREAVAAAYLENYATLRSSDFVEVPSSVRMATPEANRLMGSDEQVYQRSAEGTWTNAKEQIAQGNMALELELTRMARQPSLEQFEKRLADLNAMPAPTAEQVQQNELLHRYRVAGVELKPDYQQAIELAVEKTRQANAITGPGSLQLLPNSDRQITADSAIAQYQRGADGVDKLVATTSSDDIRAALAQVQGRGQSSQEQIATLATVVAVSPKASRPGSSEDDGQEQAQVRTQPSLLADNASHPDFDTFSRIHQWVKGTGQWDEEKSRNVAGALYKEQVADPLVQRVDKVCGGIGRDGAENVFAVYAPFGEKGPFFHAQVDGRQACQQPAQQSLEQAEQIKQQQVIQQQQEQQLQQNQQQVAKGPVITL